MKQILTTFTHGLDVFTDARRLPPNSEKESVAGTPYCENVEITKQGELITSNGYELVSEITSTGGIKNLLDYKKDATNRYLLLTHGTKHYSITPASSVWSDTNLGSYGTEANYVGGTVFNGAATASTGTITITSYADLLTTTNFSSIKIKDYEFIAQSGASTSGTLTFRAATSNNATATDLCKQINSHALCSLFVNATVSGAIITLTSKKLGEDANYTITYYNRTGVVGLTLSGANLTGGTAGRIAVIGNDITANSTKTADITNPMASLTPMPDGYIWAVFLGRLFVANGKTLYYSETGNEQVQEGATSFNDIITGLKVEGQRMIVFTRSYHQGIYFDYNSDFNISTPLKEPYERQYGNLAHKGIHLKDASAAYFSDYGFFALGQEEGYDEQGIPRPMALSQKIEPSLKNINYDYSAKACSIYDPFEQQSYWSVPYGASQFNDKTFVYNWNFGAWTLRTGLYPSDWALFRESGDYSDRKYFTDHFNSRLLRWSDGYSYAGGDYIRKWKSKVFTMGVDKNYKKWKYIYISGSMYTTTAFRVRIDVDNEHEEYIIDSDCLTKDRFGGYIGDNFLGDALLGGDPAPTTKFYRFGSLLQMPTSIREGAELQITIYNSAAEQPWKVDYIEIDYDILPDKYLPAKLINNQLQP